MSAQAIDTEGGRAAAVETVNPDGAGPVVLCCEHASNAIPDDLGGLGLDPETRASHAAWDPGAMAVARALSGILDAPLVAPRWSRLVHDCNRPPGSEAATPARVELHAAPGNEGLDAAARDARARRAYHPFAEALAATLDAAPGRPLVTVHSFAPTWHGAPRATRIGVLHDADARLADALIAACAEAGDHGVRRNDPYGPEDGVTHTLRVHALPRGLPNVMLEIRNDLIADAPAQRAMAETLAARLTAALARLEAA